MKNQVNGNGVPRVVEARLLFLVLLVFFPGSNSCSSSPSDGIKRRSGFLPRFVSAASPRWRERVVVADEGWVAGGTMIRGAGEDWAADGAVLRAADKGWVILLREVEEDPILRGVDGVADRNNDNCAVFGGRDVSASYLNTFTASGKSKTIGGGIRLPDLNASIWRESNQVWP